MLRLLWVVTALLAAWGSAEAQQLDPIRYTLRFPAPQTHYVEVEATYPTSRRPVVELMMAVWTPGSYLVREYSRHVEDVSSRRDRRACSRGRQDDGRTAGESTPAARRRDHRDLSGLRPRA